MHNVLVVDDEWNMRNLIKIYLKKENFVISEAENGKQALQLIDESNFDLIILDIMMPDMEGWEVCKRIRDDSKDVPILMLTARTDTKDVVFGLNIGADDYLTKPFAPEELLARVHALIRRSARRVQNGSEFKRLVFRDLIIDQEGRIVCVNGESVELTPKEYELLLVMATHPKRVFTREMLIDRLWGPNHYRDHRTVDTHVKNIREKIRSAGLPYDPIQTVWGVGYQFMRTDASS